MKISKEKERALLAELSNSNMSEQSYLFVVDSGIPQFLDITVDAKKYKEKFFSQYYKWLNHAPDWAKKEWTDAIGKPGSLKGKDLKFWYQNYGRLLTISDLDRYIDADEEWFYLAERPFGVMLGIVLGQEMHYKMRQTRLFETACRHYLNEAEMIVKYCWAKVQ
ncbi:hypothetical protein IKG33_03025 [Candidatus Saccharibacteria bacterium]|nr:hypothetical protein [Candidatus Saccharibacteria bacterium]